MVHITGITSTEDSRKSQNDKMQSMSIAENLAHLHEQITEACRRANRSANEVALMAVSKVHPVQVILEAYTAGQRLFGENRVQEFQEKSPHVKDLAEAKFHLIGPLQSNKTAKAAELFDAIDAVDSLKIAQRLNTAAAAIGKKLPVLVEVKLSHEESKHGLSPKELPALLASMEELESIAPVGLMTVPPWSEDAEAARPYFRQLRRLRDEAAVRFPRVTQLSMGMSNDFTVAIEEGSTCIRVGTALFGRRAP
jgi:pyridoxal phosphate enzyme (YggS family)